MANDVEKKLGLLKSGHFYVDSEGWVWCCYQIDIYESAAYCVCLANDRTSIFEPYGGAAKKDALSSTSIVRELDFKDAWIDETYAVHERIVG